jgi:hypothetical protein
MSVVIKLKYSDETIRAQGQVEKDDRTQRLIAREAGTGKITAEFPLDKVEHWYNEAD